MAPAPSAGSPSRESFILELMKPPVLEMMKVLGPLGIWSVVRLLDWILGPKRCCSGHWFVQYGAMAAYYLPTPLLFYAANAVSSLRLPWHRFFFSLYILSLLSLSWSPLCQGVMTAYTLRDAPLQRWRILPWLPYFLWLQFDSFTRGQKSKPVWRIIVAVSMAAAESHLLLHKHRPPTAATLDYETKAFADYMILEFRGSPATFFDGGEANNLESNCKYPIMHEDGHWVSIKDLLQCDWLPLRNCALEARDIFVSYSLCHLLARRYYGFHCAEEGNAELRQLTVTQLLHDYKRAFTIVDVQLAFLHAHFFTSYAANKKVCGYPSSVKQAILPVLLFTLASVVLAIWDHANALPLRVALGLIFAPLFLHPVVPKYWHPIRLAFLHYHLDFIWSCIWWCIQHVSNHSWNLTQQPYWRDKFGQYSLIEDYNRRSSTRSFVAWTKNYMLSQESYNFIKHQPASGQDVSVTESVRESVVRALHGIDGPPTNGSWCLQRNKDTDFDDLACTLRQETHTHTILIWHIATCYCDMLPLGDDDLLQRNHGVATALSRYCAYLVAFHPELLPEHSLNTKTLLQLVLKEAKDLLGRTRVSMEVKHARMQCLQLPEDDSSMNTFQKGIRLGRRLADMLTSVRWKVMAEFWAETVLYVAPSDDAAAHIECLANGGEFVTHLWAMLSQRWDPEAGNRGIESAAA